MKLLNLFSVFVFLFCFLNSAYGATITSGTGVISSTASGNIDLTQGTTTIQLMTDYNIFVDGDMYLDYSVFSENRDLFIGSNITLTANSVVIFAFNNTATTPDLSNISIFTTIPGSMNEAGNFLLFSAAPILSGAFEATGSLFIGNYSSLHLVPLPAAAILFLSGFFMLGGAGFSNRFLNSNVINATC